MANDETDARKLEDRVKLQDLLIGAFTYLQGVQRARGDMKGTFLDAEWDAREALLRTDANFEQRPLDERQRLAMDHYARNVLGYSSLEDFLSRGNGSAAVLKDQLVVKMRLGGIDLASLYKGKTPDGRSATDLYKVA